MKLTADKLYELLPAIYRIRDNEQNGILKELIEVIAEQVAVIEEDMAQLYDDQFIETCANWLVPYVGDLVGFKPVHNLGNVSSSRSEVANTIRFRKRKGTVSVLEELANNTTSLKAVVIEYFQHLSTTQYMNHIRPSHVSNVNLRNLSTLANIDTAFDSTSHTLDVRKISSQRGLYNIPNIGIHLWRINSYEWRDVPLFQIDAKRYYFHPLGVDTALYNLVEIERDIDHLAKRLNVPWPLKRRYSKKYLANLYGTKNSFSIKRNNAVVAKSKIHICNLSDKGGGWDNMPSTGVAIDPELGRIAFSSDVDISNEPLTGSFYYGSLAELAGGTYDRAETLSVSSTNLKVPSSSHTTIQSAIDSASGVGVIQIENNDRYNDDLSTVFAQQDSVLVIQAANGTKPTLVNNNDIILGGEDNGKIELNGLLLAGATIKVPAMVNGNPNKLKRLRISHCTLVPGIDIKADGAPSQPGFASLVVEIPELQVEIRNCITGALKIQADCEVTIHNSIVDSNSKTGLAYADINGDFGGELKIFNSTIIGRVKSRSTSNITNTIFTDVVNIERIQQGCIRYSYVPIGSRVPRRYRCLPNEGDATDTISPHFTTLRFNVAAYCQLRSIENGEIANGADDSSEMGVYHDLQQNKREINLRVRLNEYLRFGLEAGIFYAS